MKKLYRYTMGCGRHGRVDGLFTVEEADLKAALGKEVYFGEILGKHSEVMGTLEESEFEMLTDDAAFITLFEKYGCESGRNPLNYLREDRQ